MTLPDHGRIESVQLASFVSTTQDTITLSHHPDESDEDPGFLVLDIEECDNHAKASTWLTPDDAIAVALALTTWANTADKMHCWRRHMEAQRRRDRKTKKEAKDGEHKVD